LHMNLTKTAAGYSLGEAGGANQVTGVEGKIGDVLWNGYVRFQALRVIRGKTYTRSIASNHEEVTPIQQGDDLVVVVCRLKNGTLRTAAPSLVGGTVALTDTEGHSYEARRTSD